ncbi:MAG: 4-oxalocrotonate tautomerase family protein [Zestosphaera sp.]
MPLVHVYVWRGISDEGKEKIIAGITKVFTDLGIPPNAVEVVIHEIPKENWGVGGEQASKRFEDVQSP